MRSRAGALGLIFLALACQRREPACFRIDTRDGWRESDAGALELHLYEAFVLANAPRDLDQLQSTVDKACGPLPIPVGPGFSIQREVYRETSDTPRDVRIGYGKHDSIDLHQDDLIFEQNATRGRCEDLLFTYFYRGGDQVEDRKQQRVLPRPPDAGAIPDSCRR